MTQYHTPAHRPMVKYSTDAAIYVIRMRRNMLGNLPIACDSQIPLS